MSRFDQLGKSLRSEPRHWLVTGAAGFIGSHLVQSLLTLGQRVTGLDNFATGSRANVAVLKSLPHADAFFTFVEGDICSASDCARAAKGVDYVLHQAALGSVPRSIDDPIASHAANVSGFVNMILASRDASVKRFVYASSSAVYGDIEDSPKVEDRVGTLLSPYAVTKKVNELYAENFSSLYPISSVGLRYFNVYGPRQDPNGAYAAVIPRWIGELLAGGTCTMNGDGETTRDFCFVDNVVQANILAAVVGPGVATHRVYNVAVGDTTSLNQLYQMIRDALAVHRPEVAGRPPTYGPFRTGDVRHSLANISRVSDELGYQPSVRVSTGISATVESYLRSHA
ncbi:MAG: SDR family oxidoreductase [Deltaproteobacteria bacterium]|nr:SDR family oxidoreductase [Deltaproteobacteria bacterium]